MIGSHNKELSGARTLDTLAQKVVDDLDGTHIVKEASTNTDDIFLSLDDDISLPLDPSAPNLSLISHLSLIKFDERVDKLSAPVSFEPRVEKEAELDKKEELQRETSTIKSEKNKPSARRNSEQDLPVKKMILRRIREESII